MTLTVVSHDVVLIANPVNMVYSDHSVLYYTSRLSKNVFPLDEFVNPPPPPPLLYFGKTLFPLYQICFFSVPPPPPLKIHFPPTHRKNDRSLSFISSVASIRSSTFYSYLITKIRNRKLKTANCGEKRALLSPLTHTQKNRFLEIHESKLKSEKDSDS